MDNADYLDVAVRLANADLTKCPHCRRPSTKSLGGLAGSTARDLEALRPVAAGLRRVLPLRCGRGRDGVFVRGELAAGGLSAAPSPVRRTLGAPADWHIHVADPDAPPATEVAARPWGVAQASSTTD